MKEGNNIFASCECTNATGCETAYNVSEKCENSTYELFFMGQCVTEEECLSQGENFWTIENDVC